MHPKTYEPNQPSLDFKEFFNGKVKGWGLVQDRTGKALNRFELDLTATWQGNKAVLDETFTYTDGKIWKRAWHIEKQEDGRYIGKADDVTGDAIGTPAGSSMHFDYVLNLDINGTTYKVRIDDWLHQINNKAVFNRSDIKKFGFKVAELTIFLQKQD